MQVSRRRFTRLLGYTLATGATNIAFTPFTHAQGMNDAESNFRFIYHNPAYRKEFSSFLQNVFHLYPKNQLEALINQAVITINTDQQIYLNVQDQLDSISPFLADLRYALPALIKQKKVISTQSVALLDGQKRFDSYLEIGSTGRYVDFLEEELEIGESRFFISEKPASYSLSEMLDRGQIPKAGIDMPLNAYQPAIAQHIPRNSLDLVTVYIGFHHCPPTLRESFIGSIRDAMKSGATLIVRDHNVVDEKMWHMVALAHDIFNMGTLESWDYNSREARHFYSLDFLDSMLSRYGFTPTMTRRYQHGDPTRNALLLYRKT